MQREHQDKVMGARDEDSWQPGAAGQPYVRHRDRFQSAGIVAVAASHSFCALQVVTGLLKGAEMGKRFLTADLSPSTHSLLV